MADNKNKKGEFMDDSTAGVPARQEAAELPAPSRGKASYWLELQQRVEQYENALAGMEQVVRDAEDKLSRQDGERELLANRIIELERCMARRDKTIEDLERQLAEQREQLYAQTIALERATAEREAVGARANDASQRLAALERRRGGASDEVRSLRQELLAQQHLIGKLEVELESKQSAIDALKKQLEAAAIEPNVAFGADAANGSANDPHADSEENVEIIRIGELFRHDAHERRPLALLEAPDGTAYPVTKARVTIGRASTNDICIRREFISRTHARLIVGGIGAIIEDAGSKNGILVNSEPVGRRLLADGDIVSLGGKLELRYVELDGGARTSPPAEPGDAEP